MLVELSDINAWAVLAATIIAYVLGAVWYAPDVFGRRWLAALGKTRQELGNQIKAMIAQFFLTLLIALTMAVMVVRFGAVTALEGALIGVVLAVGLVAASLASDWIFCGFNPRLYWIQVGYKIAYITLIGAVLGAWR